MKNSNIISVDSKGRILIPKHIRKILKIENGTEVVIVPEDNNQLKILPLIKEKTAELRFIISDLPGSLAKIAEVLSDYGINIIMSESKIIEKNKLAEWNVIVDLSECNGQLEKAKQKLLENETIKKLEVIK